MQTRPGRLESIKRLGRLIFTALVKLARLVIALPGLLWRGFKGLVRLVFSLPGRLWRGLKWLRRFLGSLPEYVRQTPGLLRMRVAKRRARFAAWWRSRMPRPRASSRWVLVFGVNLIVMVLLAMTVVRLSRREP